MFSLPSTLAAALLLLPKASGHIAFWHESMYGFNVTDSTFNFDNRPVVPLQGATFQNWWFHGHLDHPPSPGKTFDLPAGQTVTAELACDKGATTLFNSSQGGNIQAGNWPCPNQQSTQFHTTGEDDVKGCALAIAQKPNATDVQPEDFVVFSVNHTCVWNRFTDFQVPADMPACPEGGCTCAWFWIHSPDSGSEQMFMNGFHCGVTNAKADAPALMKPQLARRCGADPANGVQQATPSNCTQGAKQPLYWHQAERNNMFEGTYSPPYYNDLYDFKDGAQNDIFVSSNSSTSKSSRSEHGRALHRSRLASKGY
ncbi:hypothetical protein PLICRDRAFT_108010 [Plicaturopsis crispa FD-325 SS-3]|nr:hypothetical protein PLICRDRAFT_108010 [Plicaturopsis crispa FD-325 SS-3]